MSPRTRIIENSKKPAMGGGSTQRVSPFFTASTRRARPASVSRTPRASSGVVFHALAAVSAVNGLMGSAATSPASRSENRIFKQALCVFEVDFLHLLGDHFYRFASCEGGCKGGIASNCWDCVLTCEASKVKPLNPTHQLLQKVQSLCREALALVNGVENAAHERRLSVVIPFEKPAVECQAQDRRVLLEFSPK